jgi:hypothetical protein
MTERIEEDISFDAQKGSVGFSKDWNITYIDSEGNKREYYMLTEYDAQLRAEENIFDVVYLFRSEFLKSHLKCDISKKHIELIQENLSGGSNDLFIHLLQDKDEFVREAIYEDGRGHFMSMYDCIEHEVPYGFLYPLN